MKTLKTIFHTFCISFVFALFACSVSEDTNDADTSYLKISVSNESRTIFPSAPSVNSFTKFILTGISPNGENKALGTFISYERLNSARITAETGEWTFTLEAQNAGLVYSSTIAKTIELGENTLSFSLAIQDYGSDSGSLSILLYYPSDNTDVKKVTAGLFSVEDDSEVSDFPLENLAINTSAHSVAYNKSAVPAGIYRFRCNFYADTTGNTKLASYSEILCIGESLTSSSERSVNFNTLYKIQYDFCGGSLKDGESVQEQCTRYSPEITLPWAVRAGYIFLGWATADNGEKVYDGGDSVSIASDTTVYALWQPVQYTITYELNGGTLNEENPSAYTVKTETFTLNAPTKSGYAFVGWYEDSDFVTAESETIEKGTIGNKSLYAKWSLANYTIT